MASSTVVNIPVQTWTKIATNVELGTVKILETNAGYHFQWVPTGDPAPGVDDWRNVQRCPNPRAIIAADFPMDVYAWCPAGVAGKVEVSA
jgi:hypothetical protein